MAEDLEHSQRYSRNLNTYAKRHKLTKFAKRHLLNETRRLARFAEEARSVGRAPATVVPKVLDQAVVDTWAGFRRNIHDLPIYYIACHGATCASYAQCGAPERDTNPVTYPSFLLPENTFMINLVNGEICQVNRYTEHILVNRQEEFKNALIVDSPNESSEYYNSSWEYPVISGIHRSSPGTRYPNYKCSFERSIYRMGVFNLTVLTDGNATRVFYPTEEEQRSSIFIEDILRGLGPGIFILGVCAGPYMSNISSIPSNDYATGLVRQNELEYTTRNPTLSVAQIKSFEPSFTFRDSGTTVEMGVSHPSLMANLAAAHRELPETIFSPGEHPHHLNDATSLLKKWKGQKIFKNTYRRFPWRRRQSTRFKVKR